VGYERPWRDPGQGQAQRQAEVRHCCVLKADVHAFGRIMRAGKDAPVRQALEAAAHRWAPPAAIVETGGGDAVLIAADDPVALAQTARHLMDEVYQAPGQPRLRIALHHGEVHARPRGGDLAPIIVGGQAVLCAARVEPVVEPGQIWATEAFREQFVQRPSLWRTTALVPPGGDSAFNVRKPGSTEPDYFVQLHRLES
jgi:class 3 adenylate cyclase